MIVLTAPVDIYSRWIDELEKKNRMPDDENEPYSDGVNSNPDSDGYCHVCCKKQ